MVSTAILVSDGISHRVIFTLDKVVTENGSKRIVSSMTHREVGSPTRDAAVKAAKSIGVDLTGESYTETGAKPAEGRITVVGAFGLPPALPAKK